MASFTAIISFILLLATYSYSAPITPEYDITTSATTLEHENPVNMHLVYGDESVSVPNVHKQRVFKQSESDESTTFEGVTLPPRGIHESESDESTTFEGVTLSPREFDAESLSTVQTEKRERMMNHYSYREPNRYRNDNRQYSNGRPYKREFDIESSSIVPSEKREFDLESSSIVPSERRGFFEYSTLPVESSTTFNERAIGHEHVEGNLELETSTPEENLEFETSTVEDNSEFETSTVEEQPEIEKNVESSSSVDSFGGYTGLLNNQKTVEKSTIIFGNGKPQIKQTVLLVPGQVIRTSVFSPSRPYKSEESSSPLSETGVEQTTVQPIQQ